MIHEGFILLNITNKKQFNERIASYKFSPKLASISNKPVWGEKVPFYGGIRKGVGPVPYCERWNKFFGKQSRIIPIVRHPYDVAFSVVSKYKNIKKISKPLGRYKKQMTGVIPKLLKQERVLTIKYEDLLLNQDIVVPKIFKFCNIKEDIDFRKMLSKIENKRYKFIDPSRAFAYNEKKFSTDINIDDVIKICNMIEGPEYKSIGK